MTIENKRLTHILIGIGLILLIPFIAMQFTTEVNWKFGDFIVASVLLSMLGLGIEFVLRKFKKRTQRLVLFTSLLFIFTLIWLELAVGLFESQFAGN